MFVKATNNLVDQYPYTVGMLRHDNPKTSFPKRPSSELLAEWGVYPVVAAESPVVQEVHVAVPNTSPELVDGVWTLGWTIRDKTPEEVAEDVERKKESIKNRRDQAMVSGVSVTLSDTSVEDVTIATDDLSQQRITAAALAANINSATTVKWKLPDNTFVTLSATQIIAAAQRVRSHVQACFDREAELLAALKAGEAYDINAGWPSPPR